MKAISKKGKVWTGRLAETMSRIGLAEPIEGEQENKQPEKKEPKKAREPKDTKKGKK
jgi:hypothetical protein